MPEYAQAGNYSLRVEGRSPNIGFGNLFENETDILFHPKQVSVFIQFSRPFYHKKTTSENIVHYLYIYTLILVI